MGSVSINPAKFANPANLVLKSPNGQFKFLAISNCKDENSQFRGRSFPELHNAYGDNLATYAQLGPSYTVSALWEKNKSILQDVSPLVTRTICAFSKKVPLGDLPTENGKIYIEGDFKGKTRFGGFTVDQLRKANIDVTTPGVLLAMETGYVVGDADKSGSSYTMQVKDIPPAQLRQLLHTFYDDFTSECTRSTNNVLGIPAGSIKFSLPPEALTFMYFRPGPAVPSPAGPSFSNDTSIVFFGISCQNCFGAVTAKS